MCESLRKMICALGTQFCLLAFCGGISASDVIANVWRKGALHTHTIWSDGASLPEVAVKAYKDCGYDFMCITDHNSYPDLTDIWLPVCEEAGPWPTNFTGKELERSRKLLPGVVEERTIGLRTFVRLKTLKDLRNLFQEENRFLLIGGEEITVMYQLLEDGGRHEYHFNTFNLEKHLEPLGGKTADEVVSLNLAQYCENTANAPQHSLLTVNHPFWRAWDVNPMVLINHPEIRFFEVCNNDGIIPEDRIFSIEKFWDFVLAHRIIRGHGVVYATASDDAHYYDPVRSHEKAGIDHGWVMVRCPGAMTPETLAAAMNKGDFYASCGVQFDDVRFDEESGILRVSVKAVPGVKYSIRFIATKRNFDRTIAEKDFPNELPRHFRRLPAIPDSVGQTVKQVAGTEGAYTLGKDDLYVRAVAVSDRAGRIRGHHYPETERAWTQPYLNEFVSAQRPSGNSR